MGNILDELIFEEQAQRIAEGCDYHGGDCISEDGHCLKCEKNRGG